MIDDSTDAQTGSDPNKPIVLLEVENEFQATPIVGELAARGITASTTGGFTAGFRAEAPGLVQIVVKQQDLGKARIALQEIRESKPEIDWSKVDVGEREE